MCFLRIAWFFWPCAILVARTDKAVQTFANSVTAITGVRDAQQSGHSLAALIMVPPAGFLCGQEIGATEFGIPRKKPARLRRRVCSGRGGRDLVRLESGMRTKAHVP
jgi:hypothetical protein